MKKEGKRVRDTSLVIMVLSTAFILYHGVVGATRWMDGWMHALEKESCPFFVYPHDGLISRRDAMRVINNH